MGNNTKLRWLWVVVTLLLLVVGVGIWIVLDRWRMHTGNLDPSKTRDLAYLRNIADGVTPLLAAIDKYKQDHGTLPSDLNVLIDEYVSSSEMDERDWRRWEYVSDIGSGFALYYKLGWDPTLWYIVDESGIGQWSIDPGDGSDSIYFIFDNP